MQGTAKRISALALAGVLVFWVAFPVPTGVDDLDDVRYGRAYANAAVAAPAILGTLLLASGVFLAGATTGQYDANLQSCYDFIEDFYNTNYDASPETALLGCLTPFGAVNVGLMTAQLRNAIWNYANQGISDDSLVLGSNSNAANSTYLDINGVLFNYVGWPSEWNYIESDSRKPFEWSDVIGYRKVVSTYSNGDYVEQYYFYKADSRDSVGLAGSGESLRVKGPGKYITATYNVTTETHTHTITPQTYQYALYGKDVVTQSNGQVWTFFLNDHYPFEFSSIADSINGTQSVNTHAGVVDGSLLADIDNASGVYDVFSPTAEQLQQGYSVADLAAAIEYGNGYASDTLQGVNAVIGQISSVFSVLQSILTSTRAIQNSVSGGIEVSLDGALSLDDVTSGISGVHNSLLDFKDIVLSELVSIGNALGNGLTFDDFSTVMGTVISGVQAIPGAIGGAVGDLLGGVADIPHALEGLLEGVLDGVLSIPDAIALAASGVLEAIGDLVGSIEGIINPFFGVPDIPVNGSVVLPGGTADGLRASLEDKVPFCYVIRSQSALSSMFSNFSGARSFYFYLDIPKGDGTNAHVRFDGEDVLSIGFGALDIATTIKVMATALLCLGLLYRAYKIIERMAI